MQIERAAPHAGDPRAPRSAQRASASAAAAASDTKDHKSAPKKAKKASTAEEEIRAALGGTSAQVERHVRLRLALIEGMNLANAADSHINYDFKRDALQVPAGSWKDVKAYNGGEDATGGVFESRVSAAAAISDIFDKKHESKLECNTVALAIYYRALLVVLGDDLFDESFQPLTLGAEWLSFDARGERMMPSLAHFPRMPFDDVDQLIPGDWVYFINYPEYEARHPTGAWAGENALYVGGGIFSGFGAGGLTFDQMVAKLEEAYNAAPKAAGKKTPAEKKGREKNKGTVDGQVPGIDRTSLRRILGSKLIVDMLADLDEEEPDDEAQPDADAERRARKLKRKRRKMRQRAK